MGLFNIPEPLFVALDARFATVMPASLRLVLWALLAAAVSMALYKWLSPQNRVARIKHEAAEARRALNEFDGDFADAAPLMRRMLRLSLLHLGVVTGPALLASLPVLCLLVWISTAYGYEFPRIGTEVVVETRPDNELKASSKSMTADTLRIELLERDGDKVDEIVLEEPVPVVHKRRWWNVLIANPGGYIPDDAPYESVELALPQREFFPVGPGWARGWELPFFLFLVLGSIAIKAAFRIQ